MWGCFFAAKILGAGVPAKTGFIKDNPAGLSLITNHVWRDTFHTDILCHGKKTISDIDEQKKGDQCDMVIFMESMKKQRFGISIV